MLRLIMLDRWSKSLDYLELIPEQYARYVSEFLSRVGSGVQTKDIMLQNTSGEN